jgi:hypothetical protein
VPGLVGGDLGEGGADSGIRGARELLGRDDGRDRLAHAALLNAVRGERRQAGVDVDPVAYREWPRRDGLAGVGASQREAELGVADLVEGASAAPSQ